MEIIHYLVELSRWQFFSELYYLFNSLYFLRQGKWRDHRKVTAHALHLTNHGSLASTSCSPVHHYKMALAVITVILGLLVLSSTQFGLNIVMLTQWANHIQVGTSRFLRSQKTYSCENYS